MPYNAKTVAAGPNPAQYSVYVYYCQDREQAGQAWEKTRTTSNPRRAMAEAEKLHATRKYPKVEIKKKLFDTVTNEAVDSVYKVYQEQRHDLKAIRGIALLSSVFLFGIGCMAYFIILTVH